jgi:hypothetical protein
MNEDDDDDDVKDEHDEVVDESDSASVEMILENGTCSMALVHEDVAVAADVDDVDDVDDDET